VVSHVLNFSQMLSSDHISALANILSNISTRFYMLNYEVHAGLKPVFRAVQTNKFECDHVFHQIPKGKVGSSWPEARKTHQVQDLANIFHT